MLLLLIFRYVGHLKWGRFSCYAWLLVPVISRLRIIGRLGGSEETKGALKAKVLHTNNYLKVNENIWRTSKLGLNVLLSLANNGDSVPASGGLRGRWGVRVERAGSECVLATVLKQQIRTCCSVLSPSLHEEHISRMRRTPRTATGPGTDEPPVPESFLEQCPGQKLRGTSDTRAQTR